ncbi:MAG TPA: PilT/PilU family type 4a pilus ATPase [Candidatus Eisenbacteria bacterium]|jgi:twitching motility protein PilT|nr:PilT/PilU family type 4a pilus ATPase [Candidatus Eisenbacteria bacterium]
MARLDAILRLVQEQGASDLHMTTGAPPMVRINGEITPIPYEELTREINEMLLFEIMDSATRARFDENKDVDFSYEVPGVIRVRCNIYEQSKGVAGAFRLLPGRIPTADELQLPDTLLRLIEMPRGLVLVTGPPGTGKSSTLAALIDHLNCTRRKHIVTIEDPIEFRHPNKLSLVTQREVGRNTPSFAQALRAVLREDPDVIMVGEMRDQETMALALTAAATGQLVFGTLHTMSAIQTVDRVLDSFDGERQAQVRLMLAESLRGVVAQRLLRRVDGMGRALALELLLGNPAVSALIRERKTFQLPTVMTTGKREGMRSMDDSVYTLLREGVIDFAEASVHVVNREGLDAFGGPGNGRMRDAA